MGKITPLKPGYGTIADKLFQQFMQGDTTLTNFMNEIEKQTVIRHTTTDGSDLIYHYADGSYIHMAIGTQVLRVRVGIIIT